MKIILINSYYFPEIIGGAEVSVKKLAEGLIKRGHNVVVITTGIENKIEYLQGVKIYRLKTKSFYRANFEKNILKKLIYRLLDIYNPFNYRIFNKIIKDEKPDIINTNNLYGISPVIFNSAKNNNVKIVHTLRDYNLLCPKVSLLKKNMKTCYKANILCYFYRSINKFLLRKVDIITAPSEFVSTMFKNNNFFYKDIKIIYNAIDIRDKNYKEKNISIKKSLTFVYMGALSKYKGLIELVESFKNISDDSINLIIAGKGELKDYVISESNKDKRISFYHFLNEDEKDKVLKKSDILIIPSIWNEPFGRVVIEAYSYGLPVIGSNVGGIPEIIEHKKTGLIFNHREENSLMNSMLYFINNKEEIYNMKLNCFNKLKEFSLELQIDRFIEVYNSVIINENI